MWNRGFLVFVFAGLTSQTVHADGIVIERLRAPTSASGYVVSERPETSGHLRFGAGLLASYARNPLWKDSQLGTTPVIQNLFSLDVGVWFGLTRFLEVGAALPVNLYQDGTPSTALSDLRFQLKGRLWTSRHVGFGLAGTVYFPTGQSAAYAGTGQFAFAPRLLFEARAHRLRVALNAGMLVRAQGQESDFVVSHEVTYSLALGVVPERHIELFAELYGSTALAAPFQESRYSPLEALTAISLRLGHGFLVLGGGGMGLVNGYGAPSFRGLFALRYEAPPQPTPSPVPPMPVHVIEHALPPPAILPAEDSAPQTDAAEEEEDGNETIVREDSEIIISDRELIPSRPIFFHLNRAKIREEFYPLLDSLAAAINQHPELGVIHIEGHTDARGTDRYNQTLSHRRAESVRIALIQRGVLPQRLHAEGRGAKNPMADNAAEEGRTMNRRVMFFHDREQSTH